MTDTDISPELLGFVDPDSLVLPSGRKVWLRRVDIQSSTLTVLEGDFEIVRQRVIGEISEEVQRLFGEDAGFVFRSPPPHQLPRYIVLVELESHTPVSRDNTEADFSSLVVGWFSDTLPPDLLAAIAAEMMSVEWDQHAVNGCY
jgi:hypothetical protein